MIFNIHQAVRKRYGTVSCAVSDKKPETIMLSKALEKIRQILKPVAIAAAASTAMFAGTLASTPHPANSQETAAAKPPAICVSHDCQQVAQGYAGERPSTTTPSPNGSA
jgi:hypothetical protein